MAKPKENQVANNSENVIERIINHVFDAVAKIKSRGFARTPSRDLVNCEIEVLTVSRKNPKKPFVEILFKTSENSGEAFWFGLQALAAADNTCVVELAEGKMGIDESMRATWTTSMAEPSFKPAV